MPRRPVQVLLCAALGAIAIAGCGGDDEDEAGGSLDYVAKDAAVVVTIETDLESDQYQALDELLDAFPIRDQVLDQLMEEFEEDDASFEEDVEPLLGEQAVVSISAEAIAKNIQDGEDLEQFLLSWKVGDAEKAEELISEDSREDGEIDGKTVYEGERGSFGLLDGDVLLVSPDRAELEAAMERRDGEHLSQDEFDELLGDLPEEGILKAGVALTPILEEADLDAGELNNDFLEQARSIALVASADEGGVQVEVGVGTEDVSEEDLPIATGDEPPAVVTLPEHVTVGVRDPGRLLTTFAESLPGGAAQGIESQLDLSIEDLAEQLGGDASVLFGLTTGDFTALITSDDEDELEDLTDTVTENIDTIGRAIGGEELESNPVRGQRGLLAADGESGGVFYYGVAGDYFVVSTNLTTALEAAREDAEPVEGANGAVAVSVDAEDVANTIAQEQLGGLFDISPFIEPLGDFIASIRATDEGVSATLRLEVDE